MLASFARFLPLGMFGFADGLALLPVLLSCIFHDASDFFFELPVLLFVGLAQGPAFFGRYGFGLGLEFGAQLIDRCAEVGLLGGICSERGKEIASRD